MNKRTFLIKILEKIELDWLPAWGLKIIAQEWNLTDELIDVFIKVIQLSLKESENIELNDKLSYSIQALEKVKKLEEESKKIDKNELDSLEKMLDEL